MKGEKPMVGVAPHAVKVIAQGGFFFFLRGDINLPLEFLDRIHTRTTKQNM
jgi:hypothetical protein